MPGYRRTAAVVAVLATLLAQAWGAHAADVYGKRFAPPGIYLTHANLNKNGTVSGIRGQDNFLSLYMTPIDNAQDVYSAEGFSYSVLVPPYMEILDVGLDGLELTQVEIDGMVWQKATRPVDPEQVQNRCLRGSWGVHDLIWYRVSPYASVPGQLDEITVTLTYKGQECATDSAKLRIYDELVAPPRVSAKNFRFWMHYGPYFREGHWDDWAEYLHKAGINAIQFTLGGPQRLDTVKAMRNRGFYIIAQRGASYSPIYKDNFRGCLERGPEWFKEIDEGTMETYLPYSDAALWDFEPSPMALDIDDWTLDRFRAAKAIPADVELTAESIKQTYFTDWIAFRQGELATCIKHWSDFCRGVKPDVELILTEGRTNVFDPPGQVDYSNYAQYVTFCDPMNFAGLQAVHALRQWMDYVPQGRFTGCQNVGLSSYHNVFISAKMIMMQVLSAALVGAHGTAIYPGPAMDAENFVHFNRVMGFIGHNEKLLFEGERAPRNLLIDPVPKEQFEVTVGDGRTIRNSYPDWDHDAIIGTYHDPGSDGYIAVIANWNAQEPCYARLTISLGDGEWLLLDRENRLLFTHAGKDTMSAQVLREGVHVTCPPFEYRGVSIVPDTPEARRLVRGFAATPLEEIAALAGEYTRAAGSTGAATGEGDMQLGFDDENGDGVFEYRVQTPEQSIWVTQSGTVQKWAVGEQVLRTTDHGLCRDMLWLPTGERSNQGMDGQMTLDGKQVGADAIELSFSRSVPLQSIGGGASLRIVKTLTFPARGTSLKCRIGVTNDSVAPEATELELSYRAHSHVDYGKDPSTFWVYDGEKLSRWEDIGKHYSVPNTGLSATEAAHVFGQNELTEPQRIITFGEYIPGKGLLLAVEPTAPEGILNLLRWGRNADAGGSGTVEWMYTPHVLRSGEQRVYEYQLRLEPLSGELTTAAVAARGDTMPGRDDETLLLHLSFDGTTDAAVARGIGAASVTGSPTYVDTDHGKGIRIAEGTQLEYLPQGNIDLQRGKAYIRFMPQWSGTDGETHYFFTVRPKSGFVYFGKLDDGRLVMNMFDAHGKQHYPWHAIRTMEASTWHEATATWDADAGVTALYLDGERVAEHRGEPWQMAELDNSLERCRLVIPASAGIVIDELKIWAQP